MGDGGGDFRRDETAGGIRREEEGKRLPADEWSEEERGCRRERVPRPQWGVLPRSSAFFPACLKTSGRKLGAGPAGVIGARPRCALGLGPPSSVLWDPGPATLECWGSNPGCSPVVLLDHWSWGPDSRHPDPVIGLLHGPGRAFTLDAVLLAQTHLITSHTKMLTLFPGERKTKISLTQRTPPAGIRQTSIASFFTLQPGKTNGGSKRSVPSLSENQINKSKEDVTQHPVQDMEHYITSPLVTSTPAGIQEVEFAHCIQASDCHSTGALGLTVLSALQPDTLVCDGEKKASMAYPLTNLESSCSLNLEEEEDSSRKRKWFHGSMKNNCQSAERHMKSLGGKSKRPLDRTKLGRVSAKENRQAPVQTYKDSWNGENIKSVKQSPCPAPISQDIDNSNSWSQLFTLDSQGQQVIAHNSRSPLREVTNNWNQELEWSPSSPKSKCQDRATQLNLQPDLLFTQDSEGNQVIRHCI